MNNLLQRFARWLMRKTTPGTLASPSAPYFLDAFRQRRQPTPSELLAELKSTAWACASINASVCASLPPRLFVMTGAKQAPPRCATRRLEPGLLKQMSAARPALAAQVVEEVVDHPILSLFRQVNPSQNSFDLWDLTELYLEVVGSAYWLLDFDPLLNIPCTAREFLCPQLFEPIALFGTDRFVRRVRAEPIASLLRASCAGVRFRGDEAQRKAKMDDPLRRQLLKRQPATLAISAFVAFMSARAARSPIECDKSVTDIDESATSALPWRDEPGEHAGIGPPAQDAGDLAALAAAR